VLPFRFGKISTMQVNLLRWLCVWLLVVQGMLPALVVCFGGANHRAVETAYHNVHQVSPQGGGVLRTDVFCISMHHDDYPIVMVATTDGLQRLTPIPEAFLSFPPLRVAHLSSGVQPHIDTATHFLAISLQSVVLRI
jgi:hypothetical protein